ncbi:MAG: MarR family transcriptional regulator [Pseudolabrys sp.]|jgi:DNA-binding MarR family transcriptional regulator
MADDFSPYRNDESADRIQKVETRLWLRMLSLHSEVYSRLNRALGTELGLSVAKFDVLAQLDRFRDGLTLGQLSRNLRVTGGNVSGLVRRLSADGLITREMSSEDRRSFFVRLTPKGASVFESARRMHQRELDECFSRASVDELDKALKALNGLSSRMHRETAE